MTSTNPTILICCGETSGDLHAAKLVEELRAKFPGGRVMAMGGDKMERAGAEILFHIRDYSVMGFSGVLFNLPRFLVLEKKLKRLIRNDVDLFIPVDYPGLNLRLCSFARNAGVPVLYYISPQVWAWGENRIRKIEESVDFMALILPFEEGLYGRIRREFVGHPFVEDHRLPAALEQSERRGIGILPGSRSQEVQKILPTLLDAVSLMQEELPGEEFTLATAPWVPMKLYRTILKGRKAAVRMSEDAMEVMRRSKIAVVASGTATLQSALFETPLVVVYKLSPFNYFFARRLVKIKSIGLVNIVLGDNVSPELIQGDAKPRAIADRIIVLAKDARARQAMVDRFRELRGMLKGTGGCKRVAEVAEELICSKPKRN